MPPAEGKTRRGVAALKPRCSACGRSVARGHKYCPRCGAAVPMQKAIAQLNDDLERQHGVRLALRVGINTGEVVAGLLAGEVQSAYTVVGDTVNLAQRLEAAAPAGEVLIGPVTYRVVKND